LKYFLQSRFQHSEALINDSIFILWRFFHLHAYFPFSPHFDREKIDKDAFYRAVTILAADGSSRLQLDANGAYVDGDRGHQANTFWRMLRSVSVPQISSIISSKDVGAGDSPDWGEEDDLLDILSRVQPSHPALLTTPRNQLQPHSKRILDSLGKKTYQYKGISRRDIISLLKLMLIIELTDEPHINDEFHLAQPSAQQDDEMLNRLATAMVSRFAPASKDSGDMDWSNFNAMMGTYLVSCPIIPSSCST
jgi:hypothetical protein